MKKFIFPILTISFLLLFTLSCGNTSVESNPSKDAIFKDISAPEFKEILAAKKAIPIDVRTPGEYEKEHIPGVEMNIDYKNRLFMIEMENMDKDQAYMIYCLSGKRSGRAMIALKAMGFTEMYNLDTGIKGWKNAGFETVIDEAVPE